jgi:hypothetical protein
VAIPWKNDDEDHNVEPESVNAYVLVKRCDCALRNCGGAITIIRHKDRGQDAPQAGPRKVSVTL